MTGIGQDVVSDLIATIKWPDDWGEENKEDFYVWIKNTVLQSWIPNQEKTRRIS